MMIKGPEPIHEYLDETLEKKVSYLKNAWSSIAKEITIREVLNEIKTGKHSEQILRLRILKKESKDSYDNHKKNLPGVTFCASFNEHRRKSNIKDYSAIIVLDVDKLESKELDMVKECFFKEEIVFAYWESPSQEGVKGLVKLRFAFEINEQSIDLIHKQAFAMLSNFFLEKYSIMLDNSGSDITRLCFLSYDANLHLKNIVVDYLINEEAPALNRKIKLNTGVKELRVSSRDALYNSFRRNEPSDRRRIYSIIKFLKKRQKSITDTYEKWYRVAMAIAYTFTYDVGEKYFLSISSIDKDKYDEINCRNFLKGCYETGRGEIKFKTLIFLAEEVGYEIKQKEWGTEVTM